jgi:hypothetical protein
MIDSRVEPEFRCALKKQGRPTLSRPPRTICIEAARSIADLVASLCANNM